MHTKFNSDETGRLRALKQLTVLDTPKEKPFEKIVTLVKQTLSVPMCAVSLIDKDRQWFKASRGLDVKETRRDISFCTYAIKGTEPFVVNDACADPMFKDNPMVTGGAKIRSYAGIPLTMSNGYNVGTLCAIDTVARQFTEAEIAILSNFARVIIDELELRQLASIDPLTGALTRRAWFAAANQEVERAIRHKRPVSFLLMDLDHFKSINDQFGHGAGDRVLKRFGSLVSNELRKSDCLGRYGGEEFVIVLPEANLSDARLLAERIGTAVRETKIAEIDHKRWTVSIGVAERFSHETDVPKLLKRADVALYEAKAAGRDRVKCSKSLVSEREAAA